MLDAAFRAYGAAELPARFGAAVRAVQRHRFVHRFCGGDGRVRDFEAAPEDNLKLIYSDRVLAHVAAGGETLPSTNSQPSFVLWLVYLLDVRPGQKILEIGSGSGWLAGILAHLVGGQGHVTGMEILEPLAAQSRVDLAACGLSNVTILAEDGALGCPAAAPFDRVIITAGVWDLPSMLFEQVAPEGLVIVPVELSFSRACRVALLRHAFWAFCRDTGHARLVRAAHRPQPEAATANGGCRTRRRPGGLPSIAARRPQRPARDRSSSRAGRPPWSGRRSEGKALLFVNKK